MLLVVIGTVVEECRVDCRRHRDNPASNNRRVMCGDVPQLSCTTAALAMPAS